MELSDKLQKQFSKIDTEIYEWIEFSKKRSKELRKLLSDILAKGLPVKFPKTKIAGGNPGLPDNLSIQLPEKIRKVML